MCQAKQYKFLVGLVIYFILNDYKFFHNEGDFFRTSAVSAASIERPGCYHNGSVYADGSFVPTLEPCLNCKCNTKTLVCSLKICPEMPVLPPRGCVLVQKKNTCCPYLSCLRVHDYYNNALSRRIASYLDHYERESIDRVVNDNFLQKRSDDDDFDGAGDICVKNGTVYKSGSAMSSSSLCSYCYCIGGQQRCVKPKCMLPLEGCKPIFVDSTCCPVRYDCSTKSGGGKSWQQAHNKKKPNNKHYQRMSQRLQRNRGCHLGNKFYMEGQKMSSDDDKPCDICFCIRGKKKCAPKKCAPALRSCIPVIPKGQCCPSSYDCGPVTREWDRAYQSRQIGLFSWILGSEDEQNNSTESSSMGLHAPEMVSPIKTTSEKSIFEVISEGLESIDLDENISNLNNSNEIMKNVNIITTASVVSSSENPQVIKNSENVSKNNVTEDENNNEEIEDEDEDDINLFDLFIQTVTNITKPNVNTTSTSTTTTTTTSNPPPSTEDDSDYKDYDGVSFFDIFLGKTEKNSSTNNKSDNSTATESYDFDYFGLFNENDNDTYDYLSVSDSTIQNDSTSNDENASTNEMNSSTTDSVEARSEIFEDDNYTEKDIMETTTFRPDHEESIQSTEDLSGGSSAEDYLDSEERNLSTLSNENYSTEDVQVGSMSTEDDSMETFSTIKDELEKNDMKNYETTTAATINSSTNKIETSTRNSIQNLTTKVKFISTTKPSMLNQFFTSKTKLDSTTSNIVKNVDMTKDKPIKPEIKNKMSFLSTVIDELQSLIRKTSNVTTVRPFAVSINSTINSKVDRNITENSNKPPENRTTIPPFKKIVVNQKLHQILNETTTVKPELHQSTKKSNFTKNNHNKEMVSISVEVTKKNEALPKPTTIVAPSSALSTKKSNLEVSIEGEDYGHNTLPPSLPNLEIIPFLPIDALPIKEKLATLPTYPAITERHGSAENIWSDLMDDVRPFEDSDALPSFTYTNSNVDSFNEANHNGFSPPKETEGGFVPKQPIVDGNLYYGTKLITELTTVTPFPNVLKKSTSTEIPIAITSADPFKDVIKTEPPPNLVLLIEDKEKRLANTQSNYEEKQIIHITTDANYNFDSEFKQDNVIEYNNLNFENVSFTESNNVLAESFPLDRHENISFTERNDMAGEGFKVDPPIDIHLNVQPIENYVLAESFPLDRHDDYKMINNLTHDNVDMMVDDDYVDGDSVGFGSFLDYFLGGNGNSQQNLTTSTIPPFKIIPSNLSLLSNINSETINEQLQADVQSFNEKSNQRNSSTDLSILEELLNGNDHKIGESELYKPKLQRPFSLPNKTLSNGNIKKVHPISSESISIPDPFKGLPGLIPSYPVKRPSESKPLQNDLDLILTEMHKEPFTVGAYKVLQNQTDFSNSDPYVVNPIDIDELKKQQQQQHQQQQQQQKDMHAEIFSKPENTNSINDPAGILKLAGCNIYGRMYRVGRIISELSNACLECKCTEIGVSCISLECSRATND